MPISEDELDSNQDYGQSSSNGPALSKAELRKTNKPIMEKKRRARINQCLNELKDLILNAMKKDPARHSKLEKADILELTVKHLQTIQRQHLAAAAAADPRVAERFRAGFGECAAEVRRFLARRDAAAPAPPEPVARRLAAHLDRCVDGAPPPPARPPAADFALLPKIVVREHRPFQREADRASAFRSVRSGLRPASPPPSPAPSDCSAEASESEPESRAGAFPFPAPPTPPSGASKESSPDTQKPTVSSTTVSPPEPPAAAESPRTAYGRENFKKRQIIVYQCEVSGGEPPRKRANVASDEVTSSDNAGNRASPADGRERPSGDAPAANETMWRPW